MSQPETVPADTLITPIVTFSDDDLFWAVTCPTPECGKVFANVRLSDAMRRYEEHRNLPAFVAPGSRSITPDTLDI